MTVAKVEDCAAGKGRMIPLEGKVIALYKIGVEFFAVDNSCPHRGGPMADGSLDGCVAVCPWHGYRFDIKTGMNADGMPYSLRTYETRVEGGNVQIKV